MATESVDLLRACGIPVPSDRIGPRSYRQLRDEVARLADAFRHKSGAQHAIFGVIRQKFGCRVTDLRERDLDEALKLLAVLKERVDRFVYARADFERRAMKRVFGAAGTAAVDEMEAGADEALSKLDDPFELPPPEPVVYGGNVVRFPGYE